MTRVSVWMFVVFAVVFSLPVVLGSSCVIRSAAGGGSISCPLGDVAVGGGSTAPTVSDGTYPAANPSSWVVGGPAGYYYSKLAMCCSSLDNVDLSTLARREGGSGSGVPVTASCLAGEVALGGGCFDGTSYLFASYPSANGWTCQTSGSGGVVTPYVVCARPYGGVDRQIVTASSATSVSCPSGKQLIAGGGVCAGGLGGRVRDLVPSGSSYRTVCERDVAPSTAYALCLSAGPLCGDGVLESGEQCDDGNLVSGDGCSSSCSFEQPPGPVCGNRVLEFGEGCDDGNAVSGDGCSSSCQVEQTRQPRCGDGVVQSPESCDDGNLVSGDGCSSSCSLEAGVCVDPPAGLIAWWTGDDDASDVFGFVNGQLQSGAVAGVPGKVSGSFSFDGVDDYVSVPFSPRLALSGSMTFDAWVFLNEIRADRPDDANYQTIFDNLGGGASFTNGLLVAVKEGSPTVAVYVSSGTPVEVPNALDVGAWTHLAVTVSGTDVRVYKNGVQIGSGAASGLAASTAETRFGRRTLSQFPYVQPFAGKLDEVEVFNRALSQAEVASIVAAGPSGKCLSVAGACGDGVLDAGEECDDANRVDGDGCSSSCQLEQTPGPGCGNRVLESGEQCDDGNTVSGDGCSASCVVEQSPSGCGDGVLTPPEGCDDGNLVSGDGCSSVCTAEVSTMPFCGDGLVQSPEQCDDANNFGGDGCSASCAVEQLAPSGCGNGVIESGEVCDPFALRSSLCPSSRNTCTRSCSCRAYCGNGVVEAGEECDDGNSDEGDGCSWYCFSYAPTNAVCGDGVLTPPEECDDGNTADGNGCSGSCYGESSVCGDGFCSWLGDESRESCPADCGSCGDGLCDKDVESGSSCPADCGPPRCGNRLWDDGEECDDGNLIEGDGCAQDCQSEYPASAWPDERKEGLAVIFAGLGVPVRSLVASFYDLAGQYGLRDWTDASGYLRIGSDGESHVAAGDLDGDGVPELVVGANYGGRVAVFNSRGSLLRVFDLPWPRYVSDVGEVWPAVGDVDGDGRGELVVGIGSYPGLQTGGWLMVFDDLKSGLRLIKWLHVDWNAYNVVNGETRPALGDVDGDGKAEIVVGLGSYPADGGRAAVFDDASAGYRFLQWLTYPLAAYRSENGELWPAVGDVDGDGRAEVALGPGRWGDPAGGQVAIFDDAGAQFAFLRYVAVPDSSYNELVGEGRPAIGDVDLDGRAEIVLGLGESIAGVSVLPVFEGADRQFSFIKYITLPWEYYAGRNGESWPAIASGRALCVPFVPIICPAGQRLVSSDALDAYGCPLPSSCCGNAVCDAGENDVNCPDDCGRPCPDAVAVWQHKPLELIEAESDVVTRSGGVDLVAGAQLSGGAGARMMSGEVLSFSFFGTGLEVLVTKGPAEGSLTISVDDGEPVDVDASAPAVQFRVPVPVASGLANVKHEVFVFAPSDVTVDAFRVPSPAWDAWYSFWDDRGSRWFSASGPGASPIGSVSGADTDPAIAVRPVASGVERNPPSCGEGLALWSEDGVIRGARYSADSWSLEPALWSRAAPVSGVAPVEHDPAVSWGRSDALAVWVSSGSARSSSIMSSVWDGSSWSAESVVPTRATGVEGPSVHVYESLPELVYNPVFNSYFLVWVQKVTDESDPYAVVSTSRVRAAIFDPVSRAWRSVDVLPGQTRDAVSRDYGVAADGTAPRIDVSVDEYGAVDVVWDGVMRSRWVNGVWSAPALLDSGRKPAVAGQSTVVFASDAGVRASDGSLLSSDAAATVRPDVISVPSRLAVWPGAGNPSDIFFSVSRSPWSVASRVDSQPRDDVSPALAGFATLPSVCPVLSCALSCPFGYRSAATGCPLCECVVTPFDQVVPVLAWPVDGQRVKGSLSVVSWSPVPGAQSYLLTLRDASGAVLVNATINGTPLNASYNLPVPLGVGNYSLSLRAYRPGAVSLPASFSFSVVPLAFAEATPLVSSPANGSSVPRWPLFVWDSLQGAVNWTLRVYAENGSLLVNASMNASPYRLARGEMLPVGQRVSWELVGWNGSVSSLTARGSDLLVVLGCVLDGVCQENESALACPEDCLDPAVVTLEYDLVFGENAISVPVVPSAASDTWEEVFGANRSRVDSIYTFGPVWRFWRGNASVPSALGVSPLEGYLVYMLAPARVRISGAYAPVPSRMLPAGWSLIGVHGAYARPAVDVFLPLAADSVWLVNRTGGVAFPVASGELALTRRAYWVHVPANVTLGGGP